MAPDAPAGSCPLRAYRESLRLRAWLQLASGLRGKLDPSDVVQSTVKMRHFRALERLRALLEAEQEDQP